MNNNHWKSITTSFQILTINYNDIDNQLQSINVLFKKFVKTQIDTKLAHETCAGHISRMTCLIALVSFVSHSPTCTAEPCSLLIAMIFLYIQA